MQETNEFSFLLKPGKHGVGVFAAHEIHKGAYLRLFADKGDPVIRKKEEVPEAFRSHCLDMGDVLEGPRDFACQSVGWYLNHSKNPNAHHTDYEYYALRDIASGEEITIDYNTLEEVDSLEELEG